MSYQTLAYNRWKHQQIVNQLEAEGKDVDETEIEVLTKSMEEDAYQSFCVLKVMLKSKNMKMMKVKVSLEVADNEKKNVKLPLNMMFEP